MMTRNKFLRIMLVLCCTLVAFVCGRNFSSEECYLELEWVSDGDFITEYYLENRDKYCYSTYAPHGGMWCEVCHDTADECNSRLASDISDYMIVSVAECYQPEITPAWCVRNIMLGYSIPYDFGDGEHDAITQVCALTRTECEQMRAYQHPEQPSECYGQMVMTRPSEMSYLTPAEKINEILENNNKGE